MAVTNDTPKVKGWGVRVEWACKACGRQMRTRPSQVKTCCSRSCAMRLRPPAQKLTAPRRVCPGCGEEFAARMSGGARKIHCSRRCELEVKRRARDKASKVDAEVRAIRRLGKSSYRPGLYRATCCKCGVVIVVRRTKGGAKSVCGSCAKEAKRLWRRSAKGMAVKRRYKSSRRARLRGNDAEVFDPLEVLRRDGWTCQMCGIETPEHLRGTCEANAPELDHIIPLAKGGPHTMENTQCLCRQCNCEKSDKM